MASPQVEDGFTRIANELLEAAIRFGFGKQHYKIILYVWRNTYGMFGRKTMILDYAHMSLATGLKYNHCTAATIELERMNAIAISLPNRELKTRKVSIHKDYSSWKPLPNRESLPNRELRPSLQMDHALAVKALKATTLKATTKSKKTHAREGSPHPKKSFDYPDWLDLDRWAALKEHRVKMKKPMTPRAEILNINLLKELIDAGNTQQKVIDTTIMQGWQGLPKWWLENRNQQRPSIITQEDRDAAKGRD